LSQVTTKPASHTKAAVIKALVGRGGMLALDMCTGILCARLLKPAGRGELSAMILWPVFLSGAFTLGVPSSIIYSLRKSSENRGALIASALLLGSVMSVITGLTGIFLLPSWLNHYSPEIVRQAQWFMLAAPISMGVLIFRGIWESDGSFGKSASSQLLTRILTLIGLGLLIVSHRISSASAAYAYVLGGIPSFLWMCWRIIPLAAWHAKKIANATREILSYGLRSYGIDLCGALAQYIDQALVLGLLSAAEMGTYTVALSLSRVVNIFSLSMSAVLFPKSVGTTPERAVRMAVRAQIGTLIMAGMGALCIVLFSSLALRLLYGREYLIATGPLQILTLEAMISGSITVMSQPFMAIGRPGVVTMLQVTGLATSIPLMLFMVPHYGPRGASMALVCSALIRGALLFTCYKQLLPGVVHWREVFVSESRTVYQMALRQMNRRLGFAAK
jgi:O-antigen/teichoic acid export membrane protein